MRIREFWHLAVLAALATLMTLAAAAQSYEISDLYSSMDSADVTLQGDGSGMVSDMVLRMDLIYEGKKIASENLTADDAGTYVVRWPELDAEKGSYDVCASLLDKNHKYYDNDDKNSSDIRRKCYSFYYGGVEPIRFDVRDFRADSRGMHLAISASDPTVVDIYYMLIDGDRAVYVTREEVVPIAGSYSMPITRDYEWKQILESGHTYTGRVKIVELNHNQTRAFMNSFQALDDAKITETYQDETGASATVLGNSRVPFEGFLRFILMKNGSAINTTLAKTPVLLLGDDETVEITWNHTLEPGIYQLRTILLNQEGAVRDLEENVIEAEPRAQSNTTNATENASFPAGAAIIAMLAAAVFMRKR